MASTLTLPIDKDRLYAELKKRNLTPTDVSVELGLDRSYISNACVASRRKFGKYVVVSLERLYNIKYDDIKPLEKEPVSTPVEPVSVQPESVQVQFDYEELKKVIYQAVYEAVSTVYNEPMPKRSEDRVDG